MSSPNLCPVTPQTPIRKKTLVNSNDFYYTLSTISQTLAGAFAFLVAVVLYRMQAIKGALPMLKEKASEAHSEYIRTTSSSDKIQEQARKAKDVTHEEFENTKDKLDIIRKDLQHSLNCTAAAIGACFFGLPWVHFLTTGRMYYWSCFGLLGVVGLALYCIKSYIPLVKSLAE